MQFSVSSSSSSSSGRGSGIVAAAVVSEGLEVVLGVTSATEKLLL